MSKHRVDPDHYDSVKETVADLKKPGRSKVVQIRMYDGKESGGYPTVVMHCNGWVRDFKIHIKMGEITILSLRMSSLRDADFRIKYRVY